MAKTSIQSSVLVRHPETKFFHVNLDPTVFEILSEAKHLKKIGLDIPTPAYTLCLQEKKLRQNQVLTCFTLTYKSVKNITVVKQKLNLTCLYDVLFIRLNSKKFSKSLRK